MPSSPRASGVLMVALMLITALALTLGLTTCSDAEPPVQEKSWVPLIDQERAFADLKAFVALGPVTHHPRDETGLARGRKFIEKKLEAMGISDTSPSHEWAQLAADNRSRLMRNIVGVIPGKRAEVIVLAAHYDMKILDRVPEFQGANDGASGVALVLELGRHLKAKADAGELEYTVWLTFFDGEEAFVDWYGSNKNKEPDNTYGSRHFVKKHAEAGLKGMVLLDLVADVDLKLERDTNSTKALIELFESQSREIFGPSLFVRNARPIADDHINFVAAGIPAIDLIDLDYGPNHQWWHGAGDRIENCSADSLQKVGTLVLHTWPQLEAWLASR
jgi:peptidase M28-like protein